ncbi:hypothetical protein Tco_0589180, partial [Tanacetum coccineum]
RSNRLKEYVELTPAEAIQADCDIKAINIILQGLPTEIYALVSQHRVAKDLWEKIKLLRQGNVVNQTRNVSTSYLHLPNVDQFLLHLQQHERHAIEVRLMHERNPDPLALVAYSPINQGDKLLMSAGSTRNYTPGASGSKREIYDCYCYNYKGEGHIAKQCTKPSGKGMNMVQRQKSSPHNAWTYQADDLDAMTSDCDELNSAKIALMPILFKNGSVCTHEESRESKAKVVMPGIHLKMDTIVVPDSDETIVELSEKSRSKMLLKEQDPLFEKHKPIGKRLSGPAFRPISFFHIHHVEVVSKKEPLPQLSLRARGGLKTYKGLFRDESFAVEQHRLESRTFEVKMNQVLSENERLLAQAIDKDIVKTVVNLSVNANGENVTECQKCLELETELVKKKDFVDKETYDNLCKCFTTLEKHCITLEADSQLNHEIFQQENSVLTNMPPSFYSVVSIK